MGQCLATPSSCVSGERRSTSSVGGGKAVLVWQSNEAGEKKGGEYLGWRVPSELVKRMAGTEREDKVGEQSLKPARRSRQREVDGTRSRILTGGQGESGGSTMKKVRSQKRRQRVFGVPTIVGEAGVWEYGTGWNSWFCLGQGGGGKSLTRRSE